MIREIDYARKKPKLTKRNQTTVRGNKLRVYKI